MRISDWSSDVCSSDLLAPYSAVELGAARLQRQIEAVAVVGEVIAQLRGGLLQKVAAVMATTCRTAPGWTGPGDADDGAVLLGDGDRTGGCVEGEEPTRHGRLAPASRASTSLAGAVVYGIASCGRRVGETM